MYAYLFSMTSRKNRDDQSSSFRRLLIHRFRRNIRRIGSPFGSPAAFICIWYQRSCTYGICFRDRAKNTGHRKIHNGGKLHRVKGLKYRHLIRYRRILLTPIATVSLFLSLRAPIMDAQSQQVGHFCWLVVPRHRGNETRNNSIGSPPPSPLSSPLLSGYVVSVHDFAPCKKIIVRIDESRFFLSFSFARESLYAKWNGLWNVHYWLFVIDEATEISEVDVHRTCICVCIGIAVLHIRYFTFVVFRWTKIDRCAFIPLKIV